MGSGLPRALAALGLLVLACSCSAAVCSPSTSTTSGSESLGYGGPYLTVFTARVVLFVLGGALLLLLSSCPTRSAPGAWPGASPGAPRSTRVVSAGAPWDDAGRAPSATWPTSSAGPEAAPGRWPACGAPVLLVWTGARPGGGVRAGGCRGLGGRPARPARDAVRRARPGVRARRRASTSSTSRCCSFWPAGCSGPWRLTLLVCAGLYGLALYAAGPGTGRLLALPAHRARPARSHLLALCAALLALVAAGIWLDGLRLPRRPPRAGGRGQLHRPARPPAGHLRPGGERRAGGPADCLAAVWRRSLTLPLGGAVLGRWCCCSAGAPCRRSCSASRWSRRRSSQERPYIAENIGATRRAFGVDTHGRAELPGEGRGAP